MKIGYYCESPADRAALAAFTEGILGVPPEPISMDLEAHSVPGFFSALAGVFRGVHFNSDAEGLIIVVDCDNTEPHKPAHNMPGGGGERCRLCQIHNVIAQTRKHLKPRQGRPELKVAIGLAVSAIEAWYLAGLAAGQRPFATPQLKKQIYSTERPSLELETECAVTEARRIIQQIEKIEVAFPDGFGSMAQEIRLWTVQ